jgi:hypothetical protein
MTSHLEKLFVAAWEDIAKVSEQKKDLNAISHSDTNEYVDNGGSAIKGEKPDDIKTESKIIKKDIDTMDDTKTADMIDDTKKIDDSDVTKKINKEPDIVGKTDDSDTPSIFDIIVMKDSDGKTIVGRLFNKNNIPIGVSKEKRAYKDLAGARYLVMAQTTVCMLCGVKTNEDDINFLSLGHIYGWYYCNDCRDEGRLKEDVMYYMENESSLPCTWLPFVDVKKKLFTKKSYYPTMLDNDSSKKKYIPTEDISEPKQVSFLYFFKRTVKYEENGVRYLHFFRKSKAGTVRPIHTGELHTNLNKCAFRPIDDKTLAICLQFKDTITGEQLERDVTLANLFYHNPGLYEEIITTKNIFCGSDIVVSYSEVPEKVKKLVDEAYERAKTCKDPSEFTQ